MQPKEIKLNIEGEPIPQGRPRFVRCGNFVKTYDPAKSKTWKELVKWHALIQKAQPLDGPIEINMQFYFSRPKSIPKHIHHHTKRPDLDNCVKAIQDALQSVCFTDDAQIIRVTASKQYSNTPGVVVMIRPVQN